jgi:Flp pilus assembly protein TadD
LRAGNALTAYIGYISKTILPVRLSVLYAYPEHLETWCVLAAGLTLALVAALFLVRWQRQPFLIVGWLWLLGTLVPAIGLVQVGAQSMADRYMYIPSIGLFIIVVWSADVALGNRSTLERGHSCPQQDALIEAGNEPEGESASCGAADKNVRAPFAWLPKRVLVGIAAATALASCFACTRHQLHFWQDDLSLTRHAVETIPGSYLAYHGYGQALEDAGRKDEALASYLRAAQLDPHYAPGQYNLGTLLMDMGRLDDAIGHFQAAIRESPNYELAYNNLGVAFFRRGQIEESIQQFTKALSLDPDDAEAHCNLGTALLAQSKTSDAAVQFSQAANLRPDYTEAHSRLGIVLMRQGNAREGLAHLEIAEHLRPADPDAHFNVGMALLEQNRPAEAAKHLRQGLKLAPAEARFPYHLGIAMSMLHDSKEAIAFYREALPLAPDFPETMEKLAWILCTDPDPALRNGKEAAQLAERASELTRREQPSMLATLAAAYAESGRFHDAITTMRQARDLAQALGQKDLVSRSEEWLRLFQAGNPIRETTN